MAKKKEAEQKWHFEFMFFDTKTKEMMLSSKATTKIMTETRFKEVLGKEILSAEAFSKKAKKSQSFCYRVDEWWHAGR